MVSHGSLDLVIWMKMGGSRLPRFQGDTLNNGPRKTHPGALPQEMLRGFHLQFLVLTAPFSSKIFDRPLTVTRSQAAAPHPVDPG
jgi:hypothetical protein